MLRVFELESKAGRQKATKDAEQAHQRAGAAAESALDAAKTAADPQSV